MDMFVHNTFNVLSGFEWFVYNKFKLSGKPPRLAQKVTHQYTGNKTKGHFLNGCRRRRSFSTLNKLFLWRNDLLLNEMIACLLIFNVFAITFFFFFGMSYIWFTMKKKKMLFCKRSHFTQNCILRHVILISMIFANNDW